VVAKKQSAHKRARRVFLSYVKEDEGLARRLAKTLQKARFEPWLAEDEVASGSNWAKSVGDALDTSDAIVLLLSKDFLRSDWAQKEWEFAITSRKHAKRVLPVLTPGTEIETVPWIVKRIQHVKARASWSKTKTANEIVDALRRLPRAN
jgi:hypothetical protein